MHSWFYELGKKEEIEEAQTTRWVPKTKLSTLVEGVKGLGFRVLHLCS
jgi:hypothetical protein